MSRLIKTSFALQFRGFAQVAPRLNAAHYDLSKNEASNETPMNAAAFLNIDNKKSLLTSQKIVGDVVDEHLASEAAAAARYTRVVKSGYGEVNLFEY